jgi:hypothetical protein
MKRTLWCTIERESEIQKKEKVLCLHLPFSIRRAVASKSQQFIGSSEEEGKTVVRCLPGNFTIKVEI